MKNITRAILHFLFSFVILLNLLSCGPTEKGASNDEAQLNALARAICTLRPDDRSI